MLKWRKGLSITVLSCTLAFGGLVSLYTIPVNAAYSEIAVINDTQIADVGNKKSYSSPSSSSKSSGSSSKSSSSSRSSSSGDGISIFSLFKSIPLLIILFIIYQFLKSKGIINGITFKNGKVDVDFNEEKISELTGGVFQNSNSSGIVIPEEKIIAAIQEHDPLFSRDKFIGWSKEVYVTLQNAWTARDWSKIRPFEKEELYNQHAVQLQEYINKGQINVVERINVNKAILDSYDQDTEYEYLTVRMEVRLTDYIIDEASRQVVMGNPNEESWMNYELTFIRKLGVKTNPSSSNMSTKACPNCGAPIQVTSAGQCEYCGQVIVTGEHDWVLANLDSL